MVNKGGLLVPEVAKVPEAAPIKQPSQNSLSQQSNKAPPKASGFGVYNFPKKEQ